MKNIFLIGPDFIYNVLCGSFVNIIDMIIALLLLYFQVTFLC